MRRAGSASPESRVSSCDSNRDSSTQFFCPKMTDSRTSMPSLRDSCQLSDASPGLTPWANEFRPIQDWVWGDSRVELFPCLEPTTGDERPPTSLATGYWQLTTASLGTRSNVQFHSDFVTSIGSNLSPWRWASFTIVAGE